MNITQSAETLNRTKGKGKRHPHPFFLPDWESWGVSLLLPLAVRPGENLNHWLRWPSGLQSQTDYTTGSLGLPFQMQILGLLSLHGCVSRFLMINLLT